MKKILTTLAFLTALPASVALADDDDCFVPMADWQPREAVAQLVTDKDWTLRRLKIDDGCYKIHGRDAEGRQIEVTIHPQTLQILELEYEDEDEDHHDDENEDHKDRNHKDTSND